jgi:hypothetical protein
LGCLILGQAATPAREALEKLQQDPSAINRITAAHALALLGQGVEQRDNAIAALRRELERPTNEHTALLVKQTLALLGVLTLSREKP